MSPGRMRASLITLVLLAATGTAVSAAQGTGVAWENAVPIGVTVNAHAFHDVRVEGHGCTLGFRLAFDAPPRGYSDPKNKVRNYYLFQARVKFADGQVVTSKVFGNGAPGERVYTFDSDTSDASCWGKTPNKIVKLDVIGCRGRTCDLGQFE